MRKFKKTKLLVLGILLRIVAWLGASGVEAGRVRARFATACERECVELHLRLWGWAAVPEPDAIGADHDHPD